MSAVVTVRHGAAQSMTVFVPEALIIVRRPEGSSLRLAVVDGQVQIEAAVKCSRCDEERDSACGAWNCPLKY